MLDYQRVTVRMKCTGLTDEQARGRLLSPLTTVAGVVSHLIWVEHIWMEFVLGGLPDWCPGHESRPPISVRATLLHMIEETARHLGHLDILRELTDGATGE